MILERDLKTPIYSYQIIHYKLYINRTHQNVRLETDQGNAENHRWMAGAGSRKMERIEVHVDGQYVQVNCAKQDTINNVHLRIIGWTRY